MTMVLSVHREGQWRHLPIECGAPPVLGEQEKWWKREVRRLREVYSLTDETMIIRTVQDVRLDAWREEWPTSG